MTEEANHPLPLRLLHYKSVVIGVVCTIIAAIGATSNFPQFMDSYLFAFEFVLGIALGSMALVMLHHMTGGDWGYCIRRVLEASAITMPLLTILFIPIFFNAKLLFPWANPELLKDDRIMQLQIERWFTLPFWQLRAVIYFAIWNIWAFLMWYGSGKHDRTGDPWLVVRMQRYSAAGLVLYITTMSAAAVDWIMARELHWYSSIIGLVICVGQALSGLVIAVAVLRFKRRIVELAEYLTPPRLNDLGNLMLALIVLVTYMGFAQLLIIWMGNMATDSPWYIRRGFSGDPTAPHAWKWVALLLILGHFFIPFFILLGRGNKRRLETLALVAIMMILMRMIDCFWWSGPSSMGDLGVEGLKYLTPRRVHYLDFVVPLAMFGIWLAVMLLLLRIRPLVARVEHSAFEEGVIDHAHAPA